MAFLKNRLHYGILYHPGTPCKKLLTRVPHQRRKGVSPGWNFPFLPFLKLSPFFPAVPPLLSLLLPAVPPPCRPLRYSLFSFKEIFSKALGPNGLRVRLWNPPFSIHPRKQQVTHPLTWNIHLNRFPVSYTAPTKPLYQARQRIGSFVRLNAAIIEKALYHWA